jgi:hypothetical protein
MALHKLAARTWLTADRSRAVAEGDPDAAFLLGGAGSEIEMVEAERLGLAGKRRATDDKADEAPPEAKAVKQADVADKAVSGPRDAKAERR